MKGSESPKDILKLIKDKDIPFVDLRFLDLLGTWQHFTIPSHRLKASIFEDGLGFDGSSIRGWQPIHKSDMLVKPDPNTARLDPFMRHPTLSFLCTIHDPRTGMAYSRDPRHIAMKAENYLRESGIADKACFGPEAEFFIFDDVRFDLQPHKSFYLVDSGEGAWNIGRDERPNLAHKPSYKQGYSPCPPMDSLHDLRSDIAMTLGALDIEVECHHHEVATGGQGEIDLRFDSLLNMADKLVWLKYVVKNMAKKSNKTATFMPKPLFGDNGSGMHVHLSLWKDNNPLFAGDGYAGLSQTALFFIGGLISHGPALAAFTNPTLNSYKRLVPGFEAPVLLAFSESNRSAAIRIPKTGASKRSKRVELRTPDPSCNGYLAFASILMAGIDGIENKIHPGEPLDRDLYSLPDKDTRSIPSMPATLEEALECLSKDSNFLLKGGVFTNDVLERWITLKFDHEVTPSRLQPTPFDFSKYFDV